jgi:hypothetical protein
VRPLFALAILLAGAAACGGRARTDDAPDAAPALDAPPDSTGAHPVGDDSSLEASSSQDATMAPEGASDASTNDAGDAGDLTTDSSTSDASGEAGKHSPCDDECALGSQECSLLPQVCTYDDAGHTVSCEPQAEGIWTCAVGAAGCTVWAQGVACRPDVPCCVACQPGGTCNPTCPLGTFGNPCEQDTDCASNACDAVIGQCIGNQCADHRQDGMESDIDCGGGCDSCEGGRRCQNNGDCLPGWVCFNNVCSGSIPDASTSDASGEAGAHLSCDDECALGNQECQAEAIWTCVVGGTGCTVWAQTVACRPDVPCCVAACQAATCPATCPLGSVGNPCQQDTDCASDACDAVTLVCVSDQCADHRQDGMESDVDCGGGCNACRGGQRCQNNGDCVPGQVCLNSTSWVCSGPIADASTSDAAEEPSPCNDECTFGNQACSLLPQVCSYDDAGFTVSCGSASEGIWTCVHGDAGCTIWATGVTCGSACCVGCQQVPCDAGASPLCWACPLGSDGNPCEGDTDCVSAACDAFTHQCTSNQCADHRQDGQETDVDCGGPSCNECQTGQRCQSSSDCQPGHVCSASYGGSFCQ